MTRLVATFQLPQPLLLDSDCFGTSYEARIAGLDLRLYTPRVVLANDRWSVAQPDVPSVPVPPDEDFGWGAVTSWRADPPSVDAAWVNSVVLESEVPDEAFVRDIVNDRGAWKPSGAAVTTLFEGIGEWSERLMVWVGCLVNQHTFSSDAVNRSARWTGEGLTVRAVTNAGESPRDVRPNNLSVTIRVSTSVEKPTLEWILDACNTEKVPPLAHVFLREASAELRRGQNRKAVIEAGSAAELALGAWHAAHADEWKKSISGDVTLGGFVKYTKAPMPSDASTALVDVRNDAIHRGLTPGRDQVIRALEVAAEIVEVCGPLGAPQSPVAAAKDLRNRAPWMKTP